MSALETVLVVVAGMLVGLDLASVPQAMYSRPLVAGLIGGSLAGSPMAGLGIGVLLELFAMDTLPVGAARNPDWGPPSVAAGAIAGARYDVMIASALLGLVLVAVASAWAGGWMTHLVRRANVQSVERHRAELDAGDPRAVARVQRSGLLRDAVRSFGLTALALALGDLVSTLFARSWGASQALALLALVATSVGVALAAGVRTAGGGQPRLWFAGGLGLGSVVVAVFLW